jgi:hypothetical protein
MLKCRDRKVLPISDCQFDRGVSSKLIEVVELGRRWDKSEVELIYLIHTWL